MNGSSDALPFAERIANDVLSLSRIQLQILSIHPVEFELVSELQRIVGIFRNELKMQVLSFAKLFICAICVILSPPPPCVLPI